MEPRVTVTGNAGASVTHRVTPTTNTHIAEFTLASTRRIMRDGQWTDAPTTWLHVRCFGKLADNAASSVSKGDPLVVTGRIEFDSWKTADGETRTKMWLIADAMGHDLSRGVASFRRLAKVDDGGSVQEPATVSRLAS